MNKKLMVGLMSVVLAVGLVGAASAQTTNDLTLRTEYRFDAANPLADTSGNGLDIIEVGAGATVGVSEGFQGEAYHGSADGGTSWASIPGETWGIGGTGKANFTVEAMLLLEVFEEAAGGQEWLSSCDASRFFQFEGGVEDGDEFTVSSNLWWADDGAGGWVYIADNSEVVIIRHQWHHWQYSQNADEGTIRMWFDDELLETPIVEGAWADADFESVPAGSIFYLGGECGSSYPWIGKIDNVRFYDGWTAEPLPILGPKVVIGHSDGATVVKEEGMTTDSFTVVLTEAPTDPVMVTIDPPSDDISLNAEAVNDAITLTFGTDNWSTPQAVMVKANDDAEAEGQEVISPAASVASDDENFSGGAVGAINITVHDNDAPDVIVEASDGSADVEEGGAGDTYTVELEFPPSGTVTVRITDDGEPNQVTVNGGPTPVELTFTVANFSTPQTVTVAAIDDAEAEVNPHTTSLGHSVSGGGYDGVPADSMAVFTQHDHLVHGHHHAGVEETRLGG